MINVLCSDCSPSLTSPPRTPLGPLQMLGQVTPQEDRILKKVIIIVIIIIIEINCHYLYQVTKRNHRGETPLHCSAIKVS